MPKKAKTIDFMREAMKCAMRAAEHEDVPIGAVIVKNGKIIARGENKVQHKKNPIAHAEIVAIQAACKKLEQKFLDGCEIYVTLEPCAMCATAISLARIKRVVFAADDPKGGGINFGAEVYKNDMHLFKPNVEKDSVYTNTSSGMLKSFFRRLRVKKIVKKADDLVIIPKKDTLRQRAKSIKDKRKINAKNV